MAKKEDDCGCDAENKTHQTAEDYVTRKQKEQKEAAKKDKR